MASVTHDLRQFRYITSVRRPLPWAHVRHVNVAELRSEAPDLPLMAHLLSGLADCDLSLAEVREHNDADLLQLFEVLQACLQFALWSQNILKEKLLELQSSQVARRVSARELDHVEARCRALEKDVAALTQERDTLSLGTASLRTSLVQLETTTKLQARQLQQERERTSALLAKLEKSFAQTARLPPAGAVDAPWQTDACGVLRCPTCGHRCSSRHRPGAQGPAALTKPTSGTATSSTALEASTSDTATSYTENSLMTAEGQLVCEETARRRRRYSAKGRHNHYIDSDNCLEGVFPSPCLDWRTLVRYIIHEEKRTPLWPAPAATPADTAAEATTAKDTKLTTTRSPSPPPAAISPSSIPSATTAPPLNVSVISPEAVQQVQSLFSSFTTAVADDVSAYVRGTASQTRSFLATLASERVQELTREQQSFVKDALELLRSAPAVAPPPSTNAVPVPLSAASIAPAAPRAAAPAASAAATVAIPTSPSPGNREPSSSKDSNAVGFTQSLVDYPSASMLRAPTAQFSSSPLVKSMDAVAERSNVRTSAANSAVPPSSLFDPLASQQSEGYHYSSLYRSRDNGSPLRPSQLPSVFNSLADSPMPGSRSPTKHPASTSQLQAQQEGQSGSLATASPLPQRDLPSSSSAGRLRRSSSVDDPHYGSNKMKSNHNNNNNNNNSSTSRASLLPTFSPDILRTPTASARNSPTKTAIASITSSTSNKTSAHTNMDPLLESEARYADEEDEQPPDADFRLPTSTSTSREDSYQSSSEGPQAPHRSGVTIANSVGARSLPTPTSKVNFSFHAAPSAKPATTPPVYPALSVPPSGSPLSASPSPAGFSLYRTVSLQSSMRSDGSGGSGHASSQMLRDTQRELEALLAEDAAAEQAKQNRK